MSSGKNKICKLLSIYFLSKKMFKTHQRLNTHSNSLCLDLILDNSGICNNILS